jgi:hypothetical protein
MELKGGGGDISELDDIFKMFFLGWRHATTCSSLAIWAEGRGGGNGSSIYGTTCRIRKRRYGRTEYFRV